LKRRRREGREKQRVAGRDFQIEMKSERKRERERERERKATCVDLKKMKKKTFWRKMKKKTFWRKMNF
jgi:hypothetical protein